MSEAIYALMRHQLGLIAREQALRHGLTRHQISRLLGSGEWACDRRGVYRSAAVSRTWQTELLALVLDTGGTASHRSSARLSELEGAYSWFPEVTLPHPARTRRPRAIVHASTQCDLFSPTRRYGIRTTPIDRTLIDVAGVVKAGSFTKMIDDALRRRLTTFDSLTACLVLHSVQGRTGAGFLRAELGRRSKTEQVPLSAWSRWVARLLVSQGLPEPLLEHRIERDGGLVAQVDLAYPDVRLAIELDSISFHLRRERFTPDAIRRNRISNAGWRLLTVTWSMYVDHPADLVTSIYDARALGR